jgi:Cytochrome C oxidase, cbb3-type, subunit III
MVSRSIRIAAACVIVLPHCWSHVLAQTASLPPSVDLSDPQVIGSGATLFAKNCSVGYCHGSAGRAGRGPRLRGREWEKNYLFKVTYDGIPNSSMPAWKSRLTETEIGSIVAYILTLSKLTSDTVDPAGPPAATSPNPVGQPPASATSSAVPPLPGRSDGLTGDPDKGKALFFDSSNDLNCGTCDMDSLPPVLRTLSKDQIQAQEAQNRSAMPQKYGEMFTVKQLLDIIAFIRQGDDSSRVRLEELF